MKRNSEKAVVYPVIMTPIEDGWYMVTIPDFNNSITEGKDLTDAIFMARDSIGLWCIDYQEDGKELPVPNSTAYKVKKGDILTYVDVDIDVYRRKHDTRKVKKNCTIPYLLCKEGEKRGFNFSEILTQALIEQLAM